MQKILFKPTPPAVGAGMEVAERKTSSLGDMLKFNLRKGEAVKTEKTSRGKSTQEIKFTYNNYEQIFIEPVHLESSISGQPVSIEQAKRDLSEDFFTGLERMRIKDHHDLQITLVFLEERRNREIEGEIRSLYRKNYEEDIATSNRTIREYRKKSRLYYGLSGALALVSGFMLFLGIPEAIDHSQNTMENAKRIVEDFLFVVTDLYLFLYAFAGWHLGKDKPEERTNKLNQQQRYLDAKINIITGDEIKKKQEKTDKQVPNRPNPSGL